MTVKYVNQGWPVAFATGIYRYIPAWTILPKVAFTGIYKCFIDFSLNYIVDSFSYSLYGSVYFQFHKSQQQHMQKYTLCKVTWC